MAGITGIVYVELDRKAPGDLSLLPKTFEAPYSVIPSSPSGIKKIEAGINEILKNMKAVDFKGISDQLVGTGKTIDVFFKGQEMKRIVANIDTAAARLATASEKVNELVSDGSLKGVVADTRNAVNEARVVIAQVKGEVESMKVGQTMGKVNRFVDGTSRRVESTLTDVQNTADRLRRISDSLDTLADSLKGSPSRLIFSSPAKGE
jgi:phospholipid/cholesterol/gamma-HCH transport system substrate-binding protein